METAKNYVVHVNSVSISQHVCKIHVMGAPESDHS